MADELTTVDNLMEFLRIEPGETSLFSAEAAKIIQRASAYISRYLNRKLLVEQTVRLTLDGNGLAEMWLPEWPVRGVQEVTVDGEAIPARSGWDDVGYCVNQEENAVCLRGYVFTPGTRNVEILASFGYAEGDSARLDLEQACLQLCAYFFNRRLPGLTTERIENVAVTYGSDAVPRQVEAVLEAYRKVPV